MDTEFAKLEIVNAEKVDEGVIFSIPVVNASMKGTQDIQNLGATITYLKRNLYLNALEISEKDVCDSLDNKKEAAERAIIEKEKLKTEKEKKEANDKIKELQKLRADVKKGLSALAEKKFENFDNSSRKNKSIKKHLGVDSDANISGITDVILLGNYYKHLHDKYLGCMKEEKALKLADDCFTMANKIEFDIEKNALIKNIDEYSKKRDIKALEILCKNLKSRGL